MKKTIALVLLALVPAFAGAIVYDQTTFLYSGTKEGASFQQYCYTNGFLCVLTDAAQQVVEPAELVQRRASVTNVYTNVRCPEGQALDGWVLDVKTAQTISSFPPESLKDVVPATNYTGSVVSIPGANVQFARWDRYLLLIPCFSWAEYDLVYEKNDGSDTYWRDLPSVHVSTGTVSVAESPWTRKGYESLGWSLTPDGAAAVTAGQQVTGIDLGVTTNGLFRLYAVWEKVPMTVALDPCGGTVSEDSVVVLIDETWSLPTPVRDDCEFLGWYTSESGGTLVTDGDTVTRTDITDLYAHWSVNKHTVKIGTYNPRMGTVTPAGQRQVEHGGEINLYARPESGHVFVEWNDGLTARERTVIVSSNAVYWARFAVSTHKVTFVYRTPSGEMATDEQIVSDGERAWPPADALCKRWTGHPFVCWSGDSYTRVTSDRTVTAEYGNTSSTLYFLPNGGAGRMQPQSVENGQKAVLQANTYARTNATFVGWATHAGATTNEILYTDCAVVTDPATKGYLTLYAVWQLPDTPTPDPDPDPDPEPEPEPDPEPEPEPEPVSVTLASEGWTQAEDSMTWSDSGLRIDTSLYPVLSGSVTGSGTLTFKWKAQNTSAGAGADVCNCVMTTNGVQAAQLPTDSQWHEVALTITGEDGTVTELAWKRTKAETTYVTEVLWQAGLPAEEEEEEEEGEEEEEEPESGEEPEEPSEPEAEPETNPEVAFYHVLTDLTYDGSLQTGVVAIAGCTLSEATATAAGEYVAVATLDAGAVWGDNGGTEANRIVRWTIGKGAYDMSDIRFSSATVIADGTPKSLTISGELPEGVSVSYTGNDKTECGEYEVEATFSGDAENCETIDALTATLSIVSPFGSSGEFEPVITELPPGAVSAFDVTAVYDGQPHGLDAAALAEAFGATADEPFTIKYSSTDASREIDWYTTPITITDVGTTTIWYRVATKQFGNIKHEVCLTVTPRDLALVSVEPPEDQVWTGEAQTPVPVVTDGAPSIVATSDYTLAYSNNVDVGTATVTLTGRGNYSGTISTTFTILPPPYDMSGVRFDDATFFADGEPKSLAITGTLPAGVTVSYSGNARTEPGVYTVTAHFTGDANHQEIPDMTAVLTLTEFVQARQLEPFTATLTELGVPTFGAKATVKAEGLPSGLKVSKSASGWIVSGTPKETMDGVTRRAYVRVTENKVQTLYVLRLCVLPAAADWTDVVGTSVERELAEASAVSGLPTGIKYKAGVCSGTPTKPGVFTVTVTAKDRTKRKFFWTIEPAVTPTCAVTIDSELPQESDRTILRQGVAYSWPLSATSGSSVTVSGLPSGLKLVKTPVKVNGKVVRTDLSLGGAPTKAGDFVMTFKTKLGAVTTVTTEAFAVKALPSWTIGTFNGGGAEGQVTLTVSNVGKVSGKWLSGGLTWTLSAASFSSYDETSESYGAELIAKAGKVVTTNAVVFSTGTVGGVVEGSLFTAQQNLWKTEPWKTLGKTLAKAEAISYAPFGRSDDVVSLKVAATGAVTVKGSFVTGENPRTGAPIRYAASAASVLSPLAEPDANGNFSACVFIHFPPKPGKFPDGYTACVSLYWIGSRFAVAEVEETVP